MPTDFDSCPESAASPVTVLLRRANGGDKTALDSVYTSLYPDLKRVARAALHRQGRADSMQTTVLVHESFLRFLGSKDLRLEDRRHFFAYAAKTMRNLIIDSAREQLAECRGAGARHVTLGAVDAMPAVDLSQSDELLRVHAVLREFEAIDPELAELVEMRYFGGYTEIEVAQLLGVTERTVRRRWDKARSWLFLALSEDQAATDLQG